MLRKDALFICVHNSARSQRAEEYVRLLSGGGLKKVREIRDETKKLMRDFVEREKAGKQGQIGKVWEKVDIQGSVRE